MSAWCPVTLTSEGALLRNHRGRWVYAATAHGVEGREEASCQFPVACDAEDKGNFEVHRCFEKKRSLKHAIFETLKLLFLL